MSFKNISKIATAVAVSSIVSAKSFAASPSISIDSTNGTMTPQNFTVDKTIQFADSVDTDGATTYVSDTDATTSIDLATTNYVNTVTAGAFAGTSVAGATSEKQSDGTSAISNLSDIGSAKLATAGYVDDKISSAVTSAVSSKADTSTVTALQTTVDGKANTADVDTKITSAVNGIKASLVSTPQSNEQVYIAGSTYTYNKTTDGKQTLTSASDTVYTYNDTTKKYEKATTSNTPAKNVRAAASSEPDSISNSDFTSATSATYSKSQVDLKNAEITSQINGLQTQVTNLNQRVNRAIAMAAAMDFVAPNDGKSFNVVVGGASYKGQSATSLGLTAKYKNVLVGIGGAVSGSDHLVKGVVSISAF